MTGRAWGRPDRDAEATLAAMLRILADLPPRHSLRRREFENLLPSVSDTAIASHVGTLLSRHLVDETSFGSLKINPAGLAALELDDEMRSAS